MANYEGFNYNYAAQLSRIISRIAAQRHAPRETLIIAAGINASGIMCSIYEMEWNETKRRAFALFPSSTEQLSAN